MGPRPIPPEAAPGRLPGAGPIAVIDIGSNSVRLVVYERLARSPTLLFNEKVLAGLGRGIARTGRLQDAGVRQALAALGRFRQIAQQMGARSVHVLATAAAREAENGAEFVAAVEAICGTPVQVLSGQEEARYAALGVVAGVYRPDGVAGDLGGGSLELVDIRDHTIGEGVTLPLGGLRLQDASEGSPRKAEKIASETLAATPVLAGLEGREFYAIGGTWRSLARLHMFQTGYPLHIMHEYRIAADEALEFCRTVARGALDSLDFIDSVSRPRRALLPYGAVVLGQLIRIGRPKQVVLSALGLREGFLHERLSEEERAQDSLVSAAQEISFLRSRSPRQCSELVPWTEMVFAALALDETVDEQRYRTASCLLSDVGWRAHPDYRGEQSMALVANANFVGIDHPGRAYLAHAIYYRHFGLVDDALSPRMRELLPTRLKERARFLGAAMRVAYVLSASAPGVLPRVTVETVGERLILRLPADLANLEGEPVRKRLDQLAGLAALGGAIEIG